MFKNRKAKFIPVFTNPIFETNTNCTKFTNNFSAKLSEIAQPSYNQLRTFEDQRTKRPQGVDRGSLLSISRNPKIVTLSSA